MPIHISEIGIRLAVGNEADGNAGAEKQNDAAEELKQEIEKDIEQLRKERSNRKSRDR